MGFDEIHKKFQRKEKPEIKWEPPKPGDTCAKCGEAFLIQWSDTRIACPKCYHIPSQTKDKDKEPNK